MLTAAGPVRPARGLWPLLICMPLLSGYVLPPGKVLQRWFRDGRRPATSAPALVAVRLQDRQGQLYLDGAGSHAIAMDGSLYAAAWGASGGGGVAGLWRALDLLLATDESVAGTVLGSAGVDLTRAGYSRDSCSTDGVVHTLGARGEGESGLDQVWFGRNPLQLCRVRLAGDEVQIGPPGPSGWPLWFRLGDGTLMEFVGEPQATLMRPAWAVPRVSPFVLPSPDLPGGWRRVFEQAGP